MQTIQKIIVNGQEFVLHDPDAMTVEEAQALIDEKLGVIEDGTY